jgi:hypothetical protein
MNIAMRYLDFPNIQGYSPIFHTAPDKLRVYNLDRDVISYFNWIELSSAALSPGVSEEYRDWEDRCKFSIQHSPIPSFTLICRNSDTFNYWLLKVDRCL